MDAVMSFLSRIEVIIAFIVVLVLLLIYLIYRRSVFKKYNREFEELNIEYNSIKSVPLNFKLSKASAIARVNDEAMLTITQCKDDFDKIQNNFEQLQCLLAETDDNINLKKSKLVKENLLDLNNLIEIGKENIGSLEKRLDTILEKENQLRMQATNLKEAFRDVKKHINSNAGALSFAYICLEDKVANIEQQFSVFEEYMYASEFEKARTLMAEINDEILALDEYRLVLPDLIQKAKGIVPSLVDELKRQYALSLQKGVYSKPLQIESNIELIQENVKSHLANIEKCQLAGINDDLDMIITRLKQLTEELDKETEGYYTVKTFIKDIDKDYAKLLGLMSDVERLFIEVRNRFGLNNLAQEVDTYLIKTQDLNQQIDTIKQDYQNNVSVASILAISVKEINQTVDILTKELNVIRDRLSQACQDERRAQKQLLKLQLITNEMQVKISKNKLPIISKQYDSDVKKANRMISAIEEILGSTPLNIQLMNYELNAAIEYIYKLYNNVNNVVGTAVMVENTIVFANKYRSTNSHLDSELTRSELCYRNGEYTQALEIAIASVEKLFPKDYDRMIKENALSAR